MRKHIHISAILLLLILCLIPTHGVFAADGTTAVVGTTTEIINLLIKLASRARTIPAILAGKLMSNDFIYASWLGLDKSLFTMWNYMKNFANFTLWFMLVFKIAKSLFTKDAFSIKKELPNFLLASIVVNMSWFLMGTLIDVANVATAAVGSFPQALLSENVIKSADYDNLNVSIPDKICVNLDKWEQKCSETFTTTQKIDRIRARFNDMSWPLLYIGSSIYRFQEYNLTNQETNSASSLMTGTIIKLLMLLMYIAPILALFVINLKRIFYLWLRIVFSPIIVLWEILNIGALKKMWDWAFSVKEILWMVFQPVFVIGWMAIVLILGVSMFQVMWWHPGSVNKTEQISKVFGSAEIISAPGSSTFHSTTAWSEITFVWDIFKDIAWYAGWLVWYLIITTFVIMLLWAVVKMSTSSSKIAWWTFDKITWLGKDLITGMNIIPVWASKVSLASMMNSVNPESGENMLTKSINKFTNDKNTAANKALWWAFYNSSLGKWMQNIYGKNSFSYRNNPVRDIGDDEQNKVHELSESNWLNMQSFTWKLSEILRESQKENKDKKITLQSNEFKQSVFNAIKHNAGLKTEVISWLKLWTDDKLTQDALFDWESQSSKLFLDYLQKSLSWNNILKTSEFQWGNINIDKLDFAIFGGGERRRWRDKEPE